MTCSLDTNRSIPIHCKKRGVTEHPRGAIFYCFHGNSMGNHGNSKIVLPWGVPIHHVFYSVALQELLQGRAAYVTIVPVTSKYL